MSDLKQKLIDKLHDPDGDAIIVGYALIDIILEQQRALEYVERSLRGCNLTSMPIHVRELDGSISMQRQKSNEGHAHAAADAALAATNAKLKALGVGG